MTTQQQTKSVTVTWTVVIAVALVGAFTVFAPGALAQEVAQLEQFATELAQLDLDNAGADEVMDDPPPRKRRAHGRRDGQVDGPDDGRGRQRRRRGEDGGRFGDHHRGKRGKDAHGPRERRLHLSKERIDELIATLKSVNPELAERFVARAGDLDSERTRRGIATRLAGMSWLMRMDRLRRTDPELFELKVQDMRLKRSTRDLARKYREARETEDADAMSKLNDQVRGHVAKHFDVIQKVRDHTLARLENQLEKLRKQVETRSSHRDDLINERVEEITGAGDPSQPQW
jgi:hypothetical protein